jgi:hypothetical protein
MRGHEFANLIPVSRVSAYIGLRVFMCPNFQHQIIGKDSSQDCYLAKQSRMCLPVRTLRSVSHPTSRRLYPSIEIFTLLHVPTRFTCISHVLVGRQLALHLS